MPVISSYALQYSQVTFSDIFNSSLDLFITEGAPLAPGGGSPGISDAQVAQLIGQGRHVAGYVNACVTDDARYYWRPEWTTNGHDTGTPDGDAPTWLDQAVGINFPNGDPDQDALIVEYWDPAWQKIVIDQAKALINRGYDAIFLDDVGRYFDAGTPNGNVALMADRMMSLVVAVKTAITSINPNAILITNTNPYIVTDSRPDGFSPLANAYRTAVDVHLIENQSAATFDHFATYFSGEPLLVLQSASPPPLLTYAQAWQRGILYTAPDGDYDGFGTFAYPATAGADTITGGDGPNRIDGLDGNDRLAGGNGSDALTGGPGGDILNGGAGVDVLTGGTGDDLYFVDSALDQVAEAAGAGSDRVFASVSYTLGGGVQVETLSTDNNAGIAAINLAGNELVNVIAGNAGANVLDGRGGADTMAGLGGSDYYYVDIAGDRVVEAASEGSDRVFASASWVLGAGVSVETLTTSANAGTMAINLTGNAFAQSIVGNAGANILDSGGGGDTMAGLGGDDYYFIRAAGDRAVETAGGGNDRVFAAISFTLEAGSAVEVLSTISNGATNAINLIGNELANAVLGNAGANLLDGKAGADTLAGFAGADQFRFSSALGGGNVDRIIDFVSGSDKIALDDAVFTQIGGPGALNANAFVSGAAAADANDRIIYNGATGQLFYDADGHLGGAAVLFATLDGHPTLAASDFTVI